MKKIKITQKQAMMLENLNKKTVIKITESQYKRLIENLSEVNIDDKFTKAMPSELRPAFLADRKALSKGMRESLWESFVNELYGLNESSEKVYETLINLMEACGYVENRKLSKTKFEGDKEKAKNVILGGLEKLHETGSPFMAMEAMEKAFDLSKDMEKNELFKGLVEKWLKNNDNQSVKLEYDNGNYIEAWKLARNAGNPGKTLQNPQDMEIVQSKMTEEESDIEAPTKMVPVSPEVEDEVDTITMDVPLFIRALEYSREDAKNDLDIHDIAQNAVSLSKDYGVLNMDNYSEIFGDAEEVEPQPSGEEPINEAGESGVVGLDILNHAPFSNLPETRKEMGDYTTRMEPTLPSLQDEDASIIMFSKQDFVDHEVQGPKMVHEFDGYITLFKKKFGEEPIFINIEDKGRFGRADIANEKFIEWKNRGLATKKSYMDNLRASGNKSGLDEESVDEVTVMGGGSPVFSGPGGFPVGKAELKSESKIQEALNALKKK